MEKYKNAMQRFLTKHVIIATKTLSCTERMKRHNWP